MMYLQKKDKQRLLFNCSGKPATCKILILSLISIYLSVQSNSYCIKLIIFHIPSPDDSQKLVPAVIQGWVL